MSNLDQRVANLSPEKRRILEMHLMDERASGDKAQVIARRDASGTSLLSFAQQRLWILDQLESNSAVYHITRAVKIEGSLDVAVLQKALNAIVTRHATLRTTFAFEEGQPVQVIKERWPIDVAIVDLSDRPVSGREIEIQHFLIEEVRRPFDLSKDAMLRTTLLRLSQKEHILLLVMHHIATDGWSIDILHRELAALYKAFLTGEDVSLPPLPIQYSDYAHWQRQWLQGEVLKSQLSYWKETLGGDLPVLELPTDHPRPALQTFRGKRRPLVLPKILADELKRLSRQEGVTLFMTLLAAFQILLHRYTGQDDIIVGCPIANRNRLEIEGLIGFFVNTLVLRTNIAGNPTFREFLKQVREVSQGAYDHQDLPFEKLVEELRPERDLSRNPLFQVMFVFQNVPRTPLELPGAKLTPVELDPGTAMFELSLYMWEDADGLCGFLEYNTDLFDTATIDRLAGHFQILLEGVVRDPEHAVSDLPILTEAERHQLLVEWNTTAMDYPEGSCIHELFDAQTRQTPDKVAVIFKGDRLTYRELNLRANQLAHYLQKLGVGPETVVGICVERSLEMVTGLLGVLKAGGAYLPIDPTYPKERLAFMLRDSQVPVLLTQSRLLDELPESEARVICLDQDWEVIALEREENPSISLRADNPAYLIYTSGSTGTPKGVLGLHQGAINRFHWMWQTYPFKAHEVCCQKTSLSFVDCVWEIFGPLLQGIPTVIIPDEAVKDPQLLVQHLASESITRIVLVPSLLRVILDAFDDLQNRLGHLNTWITSGEMISVELAQRFKESLPGATLLNLYGSSEVSADCTWYDTRGADLRHSIPIGRPIANTQIYLLDSNLQPVPVGVPAELHVGGAGLAKGYFNRLEMTKEKFIPNPFVSGERLYKTGDLARYLSDGTIEFLGRIDHQVKIRGFRIEPGEIESVLTDHPAVRQSVVALRKDDRGENCLVGYIVSKSQDSLSISKLVSYLRQKLPEYMVPSAFVTLNALPLTPSGKVDRLALPAPEQKRPDLDQAYTAPRSELEQFLSKIWCDILNLDRVGIHDKFFELGGNSIQAARCVHKLQKEMGTRIPIISVFEAPTVNEYTEFLKKTYREAVSKKFPHEVSPVTGPIFGDDFRGVGQGQPGAGSEPQTHFAEKGFYPPGSGSGSNRVSLRWAHTDRQRQLRQVRRRPKKKTGETE